MIRINGINLPGLVWENEFSEPNVLSQVDYSLSGIPIIWEEERLTGKKIDLVGSENVGALPRSTLLAVQGLSNIVGGVFVLEYNSVFHNVRFRNEDAPAVFGVPLVGREKAAGTDYYKNVVIKLMEV